MEGTVRWLDLGEAPYKDAWDYQQQLFDGITAIKAANRSLSAGEQAATPNYLLLCTHPHVYTLGKSGSATHLLINQKQMEQKEIAFFKTSRGGDITYHGPGQVVGYPILDLENFFTDIHRYMRSLEEVIILTLAQYDIQGGRLKGQTGVWLDPDSPAEARKICAMGVKCSRWVTMHGWALNVNTDLKYFDDIIPCGIRDKRVTSMEKELGRKVDMDEVKSHILSAFETVFGCRMDRM